MSAPCTCSFFDRFDYERFWIKEASPLSPNHNSVSNPDCCWAYGPFFTMTAYSAAVARVLRAALGRGESADVLGADWELAACVIGTDETATGIGWRWQALVLSKPSRLIGMGTTRYYSRV
jgi:hypothetical protein